MIFAQAKDTDTGACRTVVNEARRYNPSFDINAPNPDDPDGKNLLHLAVQNPGALSMTRLLLEEGADPNVLTTGGATLLHSFSSGDGIISREKAEYLLRYLVEELKLDWGARDKEGRTAFDVANPNSPAGKLVLEYRNNCKAYITRARANGFPLSELVDASGPRAQLMAVAAAGMLHELGNVKDWKGGFNDLNAMVETLPPQYRDQIDLTAARLGVLKEEPGEYSAVERYVRRRAPDPSTPPSNTRT